MGSYNGGCTYEQTNKFGGGDLHTNEQTWWGDIHTNEQTNLEGGRTYEQHTLPF